MHTQIALNTRALSTKHRSEFIGKFPSAHHWIFRLEHEWMDGYCMYIVRTNVRTAPHRTELNTEHI